MPQRIGLLVCLAGAGAAGCGAGAATSAVSGELAALRRQAGDMRTEIASAEKRLRALATEAVATEAETRELKAELESIGVSVTPRGASISVGLADY